MPEGFSVTVDWKADAWRALAVPQLNNAATFGATVVRNEAFRNLTAQQSPPTSRPGEFPHRDTGELSESLAVVSPGGMGQNLHAAMGTSVAYGRKLEFGGMSERNGAVFFMAARPWIVRSLFGAANQMKGGMTVVAKTDLKAAGLSM